MHAKFATSIPCLNRTSKSPQVFTIAFFESSSTPKTSMLSKFIPIADRVILTVTHSHVKSLLSIPQHMPFAIPRPEHWIGDLEQLDATPMKAGEQRGLLAWLPGEMQILILRGCMYHAHHIPRPRTCYNDSTDGPVPCSLYNGTVLAVDVGKDEVYADDVFAVRGESIVDEPYPQRRQRLERIQLCVPDLRLAPREADQSRLRSFTAPCLWTK